MTGVFKQKTAIIESKESAYILGVYYGDGTAYHYTINSKDKTSYERWMFGLAAIDKDFRDKSANILKNLVTNYITKRKVEKYYRCEVSSKQLYDFLTEPFERHKEFIEKYLPEFLQGFFDSEGGIYYEPAPKIFRVRAYNTNKALLEYIATQLKIKYKITSSIWINVKKGRKTKIRGVLRTTTMDCYVLQIVRKKDVKTFMENIGFSIHRKNQVWQKNQTPII